MGEFWRYFTFGALPTFDDLQVGFRSLDPKFALIVDQAAGNIADLVYGDDVYAEIELNTPQGDLYQDDVEALREQLADAGDDPAAVRIRAMFDQAGGMIALRPSDFGIVYYDRIDPIWEWLFDHCPGMLQIDDESYSDQTGVILTLNMDDTAAE